MSKQGCDFGMYNGLSYRICYGLTETGKMDYATPLYEFKKHCKCDMCTKRLKYDRLPANSLTVSTDDKANFPEIEKLINNYVCGSDIYIGYKFVSMRNGNRTEKIYSK